MCAICAGYETEKTNRCERERMEGREKLDELEASLEEAGTVFLESNKSVRDVGSEKESGEDRWKRKREAERETRTNTGSRREVEG